MQSKLVEEMIIKEKQINTEDGKYIYTIKSSIGLGTASYGIRLYTITIEFIRADGARSYAEAKEYFSNKEKAYSFFDRLVKYLATPINLPYILEDEMP